MPKTSRGTLTFGDKVGWNIVLGRGTARNPVSRPRLGLHVSLLHGRQYGVHFATLCEFSSLKTNSSEVFLCLNTKGNRGNIEIWRPGGRPRLVFLSSRFCKPRVSAQVVCQWIVNSISMEKCGKWQKHWPVCLKMIYLSTNHTYPWTALVNMLFPLFPFSFWPVLTSNSKTIWPKTIIFGTLIGLIDAHRMAPFPPSQPLENAH